ncbi:MAG: IS91 family transposase [Betaproteobacteria bacterium]|nr:IS91 family transposase [Betaproteobacteria bacterium]
MGLAEVLRRHGPAYLATHPLSVAKAKVWRAILACRTVALGGHVEVCDTCGTTRHVYHSCRNRHCPLCQTQAKEAWLAARRREVLPVPYFHLVFTLPHDLNGLIGQYPRALYEMLFGAVSATLTEFAANPRWLGGTPAFSLVLHTWKQDLARHVHAHALMAGGALGMDGRWVAAKRGFLFPVKALSKVFRGKFVAALKAARQVGKLQQSDLAEHAWRDLLARVHRHDWVVYAKQPPGGPAQVLDYLGRYTHRVAISNERILHISADTVSVRVRDRTQGNRRRTLRVPAQTFIERFLLHVLPKGFKRIRHYGLIGPAHKAARLASARAALDAPAPDPLVVESVEVFMRRIDQHQRLRCPHCGKGQFVPTAPIAPVPLPLLHLRGPP